MILVGFIPWIIFGVLATNTLLSLEIAIVVSLILTIGINYKELKHGFLLTWGTLLFFLFAFIFVIILKNIWVISHIGLLVNITLATIAVGSLLINKPFTEQYAKQRVNKEIWSKPTFKLKNRLITCVWAILFVINLLISILLPQENHLFTLFLMFAMIIVGFALTVLLIKKLKI